MGLDITAYRKLRKADNPILDEDGYPDDYKKQWLPGASMDWSESVWKGKGSPVDSKTVYEWENSFEFRAGSYSGYNRWRSNLEKFKGDVAFQELIDFADNEGVIGGVLSKKLFNDFKRYYDEAKRYSEEIKDEWFIEKYKDWMKAFEYASDNGAVDFH